ETGARALEKRHAKRGQSILLIDFPQAFDVGADDPLSFARGKHVRRPVDRGEDAYERDAEQAGIEQRQPEGRGLEEANYSHAGNIRRRARYAAAARRILCRSSAAVG